MKATVYSTSTFEMPYLKSGDNDNIQLEYHTKSLDKETVSLAEGSEAVVIFTNDKANRETLKALKDIGVKYIATRTMGTDHIDIDKAKELGLKVANVPHYSPYSVAEHSVALMLALNRNLLSANLKVKNYDFRLKGLVGFNMNDKTVGILGAGEIGAVSAKILNGLGCKILIYDIKKNEELIDKYNAQYVDIDELCEKSDIITIHAPLTDETKHMVNSEQINKMKDGVMLINTARGAICKTEDLIEGLSSGKIGYLGMDVYENETGLFFEDHSTEHIKDNLFINLLGYKNVLITAHQAFLTREAIKDDMDATLENLKAWYREEKPENEI
jgi:D-lactate dehydrogenase